MLREIFAHYTASISDLEKEPMTLINATQGEPLAILNHNEPVFYCIPSALYEQMLEALDDAYLLKLAEERAKDDAFEVRLDDL